MARHQNFHQRADCKVRSAVPAVPDLGRLSMPRKTNTKAARIVASGDVLWDKRKVARKAQKRARQFQDARSARPGFHRLSRRQKQWLVKHLDSWSWNTSSDALVPVGHPSQAQLDELVAATRLPYVQRAVLRLQGLCAEQIKYIAERSPETLRIIGVDSGSQSQQVIRVARI